MPIANPNPARTSNPAAPETGKSVPTTTVLTITSPITIYYGQTVNGSAEVSSGDSSKFSETITSCDDAAPLAAGLFVLLVAKRRRSPL